MTYADPYADLGAVPRQPARIYAGAKRLTLTGLVWHASCYNLRDGRLCRKMTLSDTTETRDQGYSQLPDLLRDFSHLEPEMCVVAIDRRTIEAACLEIRRNYTNTMSAVSSRIRLPASAHRPFVSCTSIISSSVVLEGCKHTSYQDLLIHGHRSITGVQTPARNDPRSTPSQTDAPAPQRP